MPRAQSFTSGRAVVGGPSRPDSPSSSLVERAYTHIREGILGGAYAFGTRLPSRWLASELGMSFLPILKALERLEGEGLVETLPRVSTRVVVPTLARLMDLCDLREACEVQTARVVAERATAAERRGLTRLAKRVDVAYAKLGDRTAPSNVRLRLRTNLLHASLHERLAEIARYPELLRATQCSQALIFKVLLDFFPPSRLAADEQHALLLKAITSGDPDAAEAAMRRHIRAGVPHVRALAARLVAGPRLLARKNRAR